jgi:hypothetical protein
MKHLTVGLWFPILYAVVSQPAVAQQTLTLIAQFDHSPDPPIWKALVGDLTGDVALDGRRLELIRQTKETEGRSFADLIVVSMIGKCQPLSGPRPDWRPQPLGWVHRESGTFMPFVFVDCDRVAEAVSRHVNGFVSDREYVTALERVIRHELRHILLATAAHEDAGDYRASLSPEDLVRPWQAQRESSASGRSRRSSGDVTDETALAESASATHR